jgi:MoaA/NifB/PqqE/SkfB family radical SAM enzyme
MKINELIVEISHNCNLKCKMCGFGRMGFDHEKFMDFDTFKKIIDQLGSYAECIRLNGRGESTIHPEFIQMAEYVKNKLPEMSLNLFSNLCFKNDKIIECLIKYDFQTFISIDSPDKYELEEIRRGSRYDVIIENINKLKLSGKRPFIVFTLQEENFHRIYDIAVFAKEHMFNIIFNTVRRDEGMEPFIQLVESNLDKINIEFQRAKKLLGDANLKCSIPNQIAGIDLKSNNIKTFGEYSLCPALNSELCILYNGDVTPCNMFNPFVYGNIIKSDIKTIMSCEERLEFVANYKNHYYCKNCACVGNN